MILGQVLYKCNKDVRHGKFWDAIQRHGAALSVWTCLARVLE